VLTTIDIEPEHQLIAKQAFSDAGIGPSRTRLISGRAQEVLTRLADASYDLVFIDADPLDQPEYVVEGVRLLRSGGVIIVHGAALGGRAGDPAAHDTEVGSSPRTSCSPRRWYRSATACWLPSTTDPAFYGSLTVFLLDARLNDRLMS
jgi:predicted O-methyltransferase YrrM